MRTTFQVFSRCSEIAFFFFFRMTRQHLFEKAAGGVEENFLVSRRTGKAFGLREDDNHVERPGCPRRVRPLVIQRYRLRQDTQRHKTLPGMYVFPRLWIYSGLSCPPSLSPPQVPQRFASERD